MIKLSEDQLKRYRRQLILKEIAEEGQLRLLESRVLIIGAGGLGSPVALYLAAAGIGNIGIADHDMIELSNLQRQILHSTNRIGEYKATSAKKRLLALNPDIKVITYNYKITATNIKDIINDYDIVINAVDNLETRYILNDVCLSHNIPLIEGAINNFEGHVMTIIPGISPCYCCLFPYPLSSKVENSEIGVIGPLAGVIGSLQAMEAIKYILNIGIISTNRILYYNALEANFREIKTERNPKCLACSTMSL